MAVPVIGPIIEAVTGTLGLTEEAAAPAEAAALEEGAPVGRTAEAAKDETIAAPLVSSHLRAMFWDAVTENLQITFHNGTIYDYPGISREIAKGLKNAPSPGRWVRVGDEWLHAECHAYQRQQSATLMGRP
jgi:hypothetical protein